MNITQQNISLFVWLKIENAVTLQSEIGEENSRAVSK